MFKVLGINPFSLVRDSSKFIGFLRRFNSRSIVWGNAWAKSIYYKLLNSGYSIVLDKPHGGYSWHMHIIKPKGGRINGIHIQITKSLWNYLSKITK